MVDADEVREALAGCVAPRPRRRGEWVDPATPEDDDVVSLGRQVKRFLEDLPGDASISELREALEDI